MARMPSMARTPRMARWLADYPDPSLYNLTSFSDNFLFVEYGLWIIPHMTSCKVDFYSAQTRQCAFKAFINFLLNLFIFYRIFPVVQD